MKTKLIACETPITRLKVVETLLQTPFNIFCKHDELTGFLTSGNKVRKLEYLLYDAMKKGADTVLTCGGIQSNHCRATAIASRELGLDSVLFLRKKEGVSLQANLLLDYMVGSTVVFVSEEEYRDMDAIFAREKTRLEKAGKKPYVIPEGGSNALGALGYVDAVKEISRQIDLDEVSAVFCAVGSAGTYAGLLAGLKLARSKARVIGVNVTTTPAESHREKTLGLIKGMSRYGLCPKIREEEIEIAEGFQGPAYAVPSTEDLDLIRTLARRSAFFLDPVYTAKAFRGCLHISRERFRSRNVLFIHTGGLFALFHDPQRFTDQTTREI